MAKQYKLSLRALLVLSTALILAGGLVVYAAGGITGTGTVNVTAPTLSVVYISGQVGNQACSVTNAGASLSCPKVSVQQGNSTELIFSVKNTGTESTILTVGVVPSNSTVLSVTLAYSTAPTLSVGVVGTYSYSLYGLTTGSSGFTISVVPAPWL